VAAAAAPAAASTGPHGRQRTEVTAAGVALGDRGKHGDSPAGGLLAARAIGAGGAHGLELLKFAIAGGAMVLVQRHMHLPWLGEFEKRTLNVPERDSAVKMPYSKSEGIVLVL